MWVLFLAVQLLDVFWSIFVLAGIEKVRIVPGITAVNPLDLYYMPYTHGLITATLWSVAAAAVYHFWRNDGALVVGAAVFSHWIFDLIVHRPDLPLYDDQLKVGLGLWDFPVGSVCSRDRLSFRRHVSLLAEGESDTAWRTLRLTDLRIGHAGYSGGGVLWSSAILRPCGRNCPRWLSIFGFAGIAYWLESKERLS